MANITRAAADTSEQTIHTGRCKLHRIIPAGVTTGTITIRDGVAGTVIHVLPIGTLGAGVDFGGAFFNAALTVQCSVGSDQPAVVWEAV